MKATLFKTTCLSVGLFLSCANICDGALYVWDGAAATPSSGSDPNMTVGSISQNNNNGTTTMITSVSPSSGYTGFTGTGNYGAAARVGALSMGANGSAYFAITFTPSSGYQITINSISFGSRQTSTGPASFSIYSSIDGFSQAIGTASAAANSTWRLITPILSGSLVGANNSPVTLEIFGYGGTGSPSSGTANWRIDDLHIDATSSFVVVPVPEPINVAMAVFGVVAVGTGGVRRYLKNRKATSH